MMMAWLTLGCGSIRKAHHKKPYAQAVVEQIEPPSHPSTIQHDSNQYIKSSDKKIYIYPQLQDCNKPVHSGQMK